MSRHRWVLSLLLLTILVEWMQPDTATSPGVGAGSYPLHWNQRYLL